MPDRRGRASNRVAPKQRRRPCLHLFHGHLSLSTAIPVLHYCHPMTACILHNSFLRLIASALMPVDCGVERSRIVGDAEIRIDVFPPTGARPPAGAAAGYDSDG